LDYLTNGVGFAGKPRRSEMFVDQELKKFIEFREERHFRDAVPTELKKNDQYQSDKHFVPQGTRFMIK
jgi:hypothetical protein